MNTAKPGTARRSRIPLRYREDPLDLTVYRGDKSVNRLSVIFGAFVSVVLVGLLADRGGRSVATYVISPLVLCAMAMVLWVTVVLAAVRVRADGLVIDNLLVRHVIPWERFAGLFVEPGKGMFARLEDGKEIRCSAYGRSLADALTGYKDMRAALEQIREDCSRARMAHARVDPPPAYRLRVNVPWRPLLVSLAFFEAVSWIIFAMHAG